MTLFNDDGTRKVFAVPKPEGKGKKSKGSLDAPSKTTKSFPKGQDAVEAVKSLVAEANNNSGVPPRTRKEINDNNRNYGKAVERQVAKLTGGSRVPASGAIKNSNLALEGDVQVFYPDSREMLAMIECKGTSTILPSGDKSYTLKKSVLKQMNQEAEMQHAIGGLWLHFKDDQYEQDDYVIVPAKHFLKLLDLAKQNHGERDE